MAAAKKRVRRADPSSGRVRDVLLVVALVVAAAILTRDDLRRLSCTEGDKPTRVVDVTFGSQRPAGTPIVLVTSGCIEAADGISVPPRSSCRIDFWLTRDAGERARILLNILRADGVSNVVTVHHPSSAYAEVIGRDVSVMDEMDLPVRGRAAVNAPELVLQSTNSTDAPSHVLRQVRYTTLGDATPCLVDLRRLFAVWGAVIFAAATLWWLRASPAGQWSIAIAAAAMMLFSALVTNDLATWFALVALVFVLDRAMKSIPDRALGATMVTAAALWAIGVVFVRLRYPYLARNVNLRLDPDAVMYRLYADQMSLFSSTGFFSGTSGDREPLYIFVVHLLFRLIGSSDLHTRYASFLCALPMPFLTYAMARLSGARRVPSAIAAVAVCVANPYIRYLPSRGLRDDLFITLSAAFIVAVLLSLRSSSKWRWIPIAVVGVFCEWTRTATVVFAIALFVWLLIECAFYRHRLTELFGWPRRWTVWESALCLVIIYASFFPIRMSWKKIYGFSDASERNYARVLANTEFPDRLGTPGFPSREAFQSSSYAGPPMTLREYVGLHTFSDLAAGTFIGTVGAIRDVLPRFNITSEWINIGVEIVFGVLILASFFFARSRLLTMAGLASLSYAGFFYDRQLIELRSAVHVLLPLAAAALLAADLAVRRFHRLPVS